MRSPERLDEFYNYLCEIHKKYFCDWRFGQFIYNFLSWYGKDPFYLEEDKMKELIEQFINEIGLK